MKPSNVLIPFLLCSCLLSCTRPSSPSVKTGPETLTVADSTQTKVLAPSQSLFDLFRLLSREPKNVALSPLSLKLAFGLLQPGASVSTKASLDALFGFDKTQTSIASTEFQLLDETLKNKKSFEFSITNSVWLKDPKQIHPEYKKGIAPLRAEVQRLQVKELNAWVEKATSGKITQLMDQLKPGTLALALNTVYLKALWTRPFPKDQTIQGRFQPSPHATQVVPMMQQKARFRHQEDKTSRWVELPYRDTPLVMVIGLPKKRFDLKSVEERIGSEFLKEMKSQWKDRQVDLVLPRFSVKLKESLQPLMKTAGFGALFAKGAFPKVLKSGDVTAAEVIQAVSIDVQEEGTEAAAATAVTLERAALFEGSTVPFYADEPFLFLLMNPESGEIYFIGKVFDPTQG
jgi:serpin B